MYTEYFIHPNDAKALKALKAIPGFPLLTKKFLDVFYERGWKISNLSSRLKLSERQFPDIYGILPPICEKLEIQVPEMYIEQDPYINACTFGETNPCIILTSGLINNCSSDVIKAVIAHECGHIVCKHVMYKTMARFFLGVGAKILNVPFLSFSLEYALLYWDRCSEYSADRAAAYVCGGPDTVVKTMTELASGLPTMVDEINQEEFLKQAEEFHEYSDESAWNKFLMYYQLLGTNHPFTSDRAADIIKWCDSRYYADLCNGVPYGSNKEYSMDNYNVNNELNDNLDMFSNTDNNTPFYESMDRCPVCQLFIDKNSVYCPYCGNKIIL